MSTPYALTYDGSFEGWLCVVAEAARRRALPVRIEREGEAGQTGLFADAEAVLTNAPLAGRVERALCRKASPGVVQKLYRILLSERPGVEREGAAAALRLLHEGPNVLSDYGDPGVVLINRLDKQVRREVHRMHAFVRFEEVDGLYAAVVEPESHVLPLLGDHFGRRYPAMRWAIFDARRRCGLYHEEGRLQLVREMGGGTLASAERAARTSEQAQLWRAYLRAVTIPERANPRLQLQHLPRRYWHRLPEKQPDLPTE